MKADDLPKPRAGGHAQRWVPSCARPGAVAHPQLQRKSVSQRGLENNSNEDESAANVFVGAVLLNA